MNDNDEKTELSLMVHQNMLKSKPTEISGLEIEENQLQKIQHLD